MECIILSVKDTYMDAQEVMHMTDYSKITALYSRLSVGDEDRDGGESNSIQNQKIFLENYARGQHLTNIRHYIDDDESGRFFDRSAYSRMMDDVENGKIGVCEATCPDHYCMKRGFCNSGTEIVCLPNRLTIRFLGQQEIDAVVG